MRPCGRQMPAALLPTWVAFTTRGLVGVNELGTHIRQRSDRLQVIDQQMLFGMGQRF